MVAQFDFTGAAGRELYGGLLGEAVADGHDGWMEDFGEYTPLDARAADGSDGPGAAQPLPAPVPLRRAARARAARRSRASCARAGPASRAARRSSGAAIPTSDWGFDGLRSVVTNGLTMGLSGVSTWGSDIGGFFALFEQPADAGAARCAGSSRRGVRCDAHAGERHPHPRQPAPADLGPTIVRPTGAAGRSCAPSSIPTWRRPTREYRRSGLPIMRHLALAYPAATAARRARGRRVPVRPRPAGRAGARPGRDAAVALPAARALGRPVALGQLPPRTAATSPLRRARLLRGGREIDAARAAGRAAAARARRHAARAAAAGRGHAGPLRQARRVPSLAERAAGACCWPSRAGARARGSRTAAAALAREPAAAGACTLRIADGARAGRSRRRSPRCAGRFGPAG